MNETTGFVMRDYSPIANHGIYDGVTLNNTIAPDGSPAPFFDGVNDFASFLSAAFYNVWNGDEHTLQFWGKVFDANVWTDGSNRIAIYVSEDTPFCNIKMRKDKVNNTWKNREFRNTGLNQDGDITISDTGWNCYGMVTSRSGDYMKTYLNGDLVDTDTAPGIWDATESERLSIGSRDSAAFWYGWLSKAAIWNTALSDDEMKINGKQ